MKRAKRRYANGGAIGGLGTIGGGLLASNPYNPNGSVNDGRYIAGKSISMAGQGAAAGSAFGPWGTAIGGALGLGAGLYEGITGAKKLMDQRDQQLSDEEQARQDEADRQAELDKQNADYKQSQQNTWNSSYYSNSDKNPNGIEDATIYAKMGGSLNCNYPHNRRNRAGVYRTVPYYAGGGSLPVEGGELQPLAYNTVKAEGNTHEQGGIQLNSQGQPLAEVEDQEVIAGDKVYSDSIKLPNGKTIAQEAEKYSKMKGKAEKNLNPTDFRSTNTANRISEFADMKLGQLYNYQESTKRPNVGRKFDRGGQLNYGPEPQPAWGSQGIMAAGYQPGAYEDALRNNPGMVRYSPPTMDEGEDPSIGFNQTLQNDPRFASRTSMTAPPVIPSNSSNSSSGYRWSQIGNALGNGLEMVTPFVDNIYNSKLINQAPQVPRPMMRNYYDLQAMPLKTTYDVSKNLSDANDSYRSFNADLNQNTSSSSVARANKLGAYSNLIKNQGDIYQNKNNIETGLVNNSIMNNQNVANANTRNRQDISNYNLGLQDSYNYNNYQRSDRLLDAKSANVANAVDDARMLMYDRNARGLDRERMSLDSLQDPSGAGTARMVGSRTMDRMVNDPQYYKQVESALIKGGQTKALNDFHKRYGKRR